MRAFTAVVCSGFVLGVLAAASGCAEDSPFLCPDAHELLAQIKRQGEGRVGESTTVARAQVPENNAPKVVAPPPGTATAARIFATVNGQAILDEEIRALCYRELAMANQLPEPERTKARNEVWKQALDRLINRELAMQDAEVRLSKGPNKAMLGKLQEIASREFEKNWVKPNMKAFKLNTEQELRDLLRSQDTSFELVRRSWERDFMHMEYLKNLVYPKVDKLGHPELLEYYNTHQEDYRVPDSVEWIDLFISSTTHSPQGAQERARVVAEALRRGEGYEGLKKYDDGTGTLRNGAGIGRKRGEIKPPEAEATLFQMREGEVGILETSSGYHVFRLGKREHAGVKPFDENLQKDIRDKLRNDVGQREVKRVLAELRRKAVIEYPN